MERPLSRIFFDPKEKERGGQTGREVAGNMRPASLLIRRPQPVKPSGSP